MNQKNFEYLKDQVKFTGFGDALENEMNEKIQVQKPEFQLAHQVTYGKDTVAATLHFKKSDQNDMYFFNKFDLALKAENTAEALNRTFYVNKGNTTTLKEAYNLLSGRAVNKDLTNKDGQLYNAWVQLDFGKTDASGNFHLKQFHQNYGYDLEKALSAHPIRELNKEPDKTRLIESLQRGNRQSVTFVQNGREEKHFIEANPQFHSVTIHDAQMQRVHASQTKGEKQGEGERTGKEKTQNSRQAQGGAEDGAEVPKGTRQRRKKQNQSL